MTNIRMIFLLLLTCSTFSCKEYGIEIVIPNANDLEENLATETVILGDFNFHPTSTTNVVYNRKGFSFSYSEAHEQSEWVAYELTHKDMVATNYNRPYFNQDPIVSTASADWRNFKKSGFNVN